MQKLEIDEKLINENINRINKKLRVSHDKLSYIGAKLNFNEIYEILWKITNFWI